jgi:putative aldouronate transport system substrate-binding protein
MSRPMKRTGLTVAAALTTAALTLSACTPSGDKGDPTTLSIFSPQDAGRDLATSPFTKAVEGEIGMKLSFETTTYDAGAAAEKRQIALASNDYPDVFMLVPWIDQFSPAELLKLSKQGVVLPLNDLIKEYAPNITKALESTPELKSMATAPDGNIYGLPQWNDCYHCSYSSKLWLNSDWLKKLGLKQPTTTEEMRSVLLAFKTKDPNGNGKADEIPITGNTSDTLLPYFMNAFIYDPQAGDAYPSTLAMGSGKVQLQAAQDGWRDGLKYIASLYSQGLIDPGAFTQNRDSMKAEGDLAEATIVGAVTSQHPATLVTLGQKDGRDKNYDAVAPLVGPSGGQYASFNLPSIAGASFVITNKASKDKQVAAIKMLDKLYTDEGHLNAEFGEEGVGWVKPGSGDVAVDAKKDPLFKALPADPNNPTANNAWGALAQYNSNATFRGSQVSPTDVYDKTGFERRLFQATELYAPHTPKDQVFPYWNVWVGEGEASELATLQTNIENFVSQSGLEFVTGTKNPGDDHAWDSYIQGLKSLGLDRYLAIMQAAYDASPAARK